MVRWFVILALLACSGVNAHQFTPTYPKLTSSYIEGVLHTEMKLFNRRNDVEYYELSVFDKDWNEVEFAIIGGKIFSVPYLQTKSLDIYISNKDAPRVVYICTTSKIVRKDVSSTLISSKICSKVK